MAPTGSSAKGIGEKKKRRQKEMRKIKKMIRDEDEYGEMSLFTVYTYVFCLSRYVGEI